MVISRLHRFHAWVGVSPRKKMVVGEVLMDDQLINNGHDKSSNFRQLQYSIYEIYRSHDS